MKKPSAGMGRVIASIAHEIRQLWASSVPAPNCFNAARTRLIRATAARILGAIYDESVRLSQTGQ